MARSSQQTLKLLYLKDYLTRNTDVAHPASTKQIIDHLAAQGIPVLRLPAL